MEMLVINAKHLIWIREDVNKPSGTNEPQTLDPFKMA